MKSTPSADARNPSPAGCATTNRLAIHVFHRLLPAAFCLLLLLAGCPKPEADSTGLPTERPLEGLELRLAVVDDPALAAAIIRLRGEWNSQTGADLHVEEMTQADLLEADALPADAVLCASHLLGVLAERDQIVPVPPSVLDNVEWGGVFELLRLREAAWGDRIMAVPFGSPVLTCYYRADLLERVGRRPPRTWSEYEELAKLLAAEKPSEADASWCGTIEPLAPGWAGLVLLARAAPYAKHRDNYATLFDVETMEPMVASPPFVRALEELAAAAKLGPAHPLDYDPAAARAAFWRGECGMALTWPTAAEQGQTTAGDRSIFRRENEFGEKSVGRKHGPVPFRDADAGKTSENPPIEARFVELPGSRQVFNLDRREWDKRAEDDDRRVPLLAVAGRLGVVGKDSAHPEAAFQLLRWLSDDRMSPQVSAASPATTLFRQSNLKSPGQWVEKPASAAALQYGDATQSALSHEQWLGALRLPGRTEYLAALDDAVRAVVVDQEPPLDALLQADKTWREITEGLGIDSQRAAYRHSLGLD